MLHNYWLFSNKETLICVFTLDLISHSFFTAAYRALVCNDDKEIIPIGVTNSTEREKILKKVNETVEENKKIVKENKEAKEKLKTTVAPTTGPGKRRFSWWRPKKADSFCFKFNYLKYLREWFWKTKTQSVVVLPRNYFNSKKKKIRCWSLNILDIQALRSHGKPNFKPYFSRNGHR